jgi:hypothetical protein
MRISISGVSEGAAVRRAEAVIRRELAQLEPRGSLSVAAHRLHNGDWSLVVFDGVDVRTVPDGWSERVQLALRKTGV